MAKANSNKRVSCKVKVKPPSEHQEQAAYFEWVDAHIPKYPLMKNIMATPNQGQRSFATAAMMKKEGLKKGFPDISVLIPVKPFHALFIELKRKPNKTTASQKDWIERLNKTYYLAKVCYSGAEAIELTKEYLGRAGFKF